MPDFNPKDHPGFFSPEAQHLLEQSAVTERQIAERLRRQQQPAPRDDVPPVPSFDPHLNEDQTRQRLALAIKAHDAAMVVVGTAEANLTRAKARVDEADKALGNYADLDQQIGELQPRLSILLHVERHLDMGTTEHPSLLHRLHPRRRLQRWSTRSC